MKTISRSEAVEQIENSKGRIFSAISVKKNGEKRLFNCSFKKGGKTKLGYLKVWDMQAKSIKTLDPREMSYLKINGIEKKVK